MFPPIDRYQVCVGDLCYVALGKIVGRNYYCAQGAPIQAFSDSPAHKPRLCAALRAVWGSKSPRQMLLDSLLIDYSTRAILRAPEYLALYDSTEFQIHAATRLLYYYPEFAAPLIARRLDSFDVRYMTLDHKLESDAVAAKRQVERMITNRVHEEQFIRAVAWCPAPPIRKALAGIIARTDDPQTVRAAKGIID